MYEKEKGGEKGRMEAGGGGREKQRDKERMFLRFTLQHSCKGPPMMVLHD